METTNQVNIIGASGHAKVIIEIAEHIGVAIHKVFDTNPNLTTLIGYKVHLQGSLAQETSGFVIAVGNNHIRKVIATKYNLQYLTLVHPKSVISPRAILGKGTVVMSGVTINSCAVVGEHAIINTNASIDHDCSIGHFAHISPNVGLAGNVSVGEGTHVGIGAQVIQGIKIGKWCTIGAGAVVIRDIPDFAVAVGNPAQIIKYNKDILE